MVSHHVLVWLIFRFANLWLFENKCASCEHAETIDDVIENVFLYSVTCCKKYESTFAIIVPWICAIVTRLAMYSFCDHENFMRFKIAFFLNNVLDILIEFLVLLVVFWQNIFHQFVLVGRLKNLFIRFFL